MASATGRGMRQCRASSSPSPPPLDVSFATIGAAVFVGWRPGVRQLAGLLIVMFIAVWHIYGKSQA